MRKHSNCKAGSLSGNSLPWNEYKDSLPCRPLDPILKQTNTLNLTLYFIQISFNIPLANLTKKHRAILMLKHHEDVCDKEERLQAF
jgi:hypothetical protein